MSFRWTCTQWLSKLLENFPPPRFSRRDVWRKRSRLPGSGFSSAAEILEDRLLLAATITVNDEIGQTIQGAIDAAQPGDTILVTGGTDGIHTEAGITVSKDLTIQGGSNPLFSQVIVQAGEEAGIASDRVFLIEVESAVTIDNLTIRYGNITSDASAGLDGGGILNQGALTITNSTITDNTAEFDGGGISNDGGILTIQNTTISNNTAGGDGGGIDIDGGSVTLRESTISGNSAQDDGGGIDNIVGSVFLANSTISGNHAGGDGGGIRNVDTLVVVNSTIVLNVAGEGSQQSAFGGGIDNFAPESEVFALLVNSIVAGNVAGSSETPSDLTGLNVATDSEFNLIGDPASSGGLVHGVNDNIVGQFDGIEGRELLDLATVLDLNLADNGGPTLTHNLITGSPAIDAGNNDLALGPDEQPLETDQRGFPRIVDIPSVTNVAGGIDIGAVELSSAANVSVFPLDFNQREGDSGQTDFQFLVIRTNAAGPASVEYSVTNITTDANDFVGGVLPAGVVQFQEGQTVAILTIPVQGDFLLEANETFLVTLANPSIGLTLDLGTATGEIVNDETIEVFGAGSGVGVQSMPPQVIVRESKTGTLIRSFLAYDARFLGGVRVATADVNGDGAPDVITAAGPGGGPHVRAFDGLTGQVLTEFFAYAANFTGGVFVAAGDVNEDGFADIITGAGAGGGPHVRVFDSQTLGVVHDFFAYNPLFLGGVSVAAGDINNDSVPDIITGAGPGGGPHVRVFDGARPDLSLAGVNIPGPLGSFFAYNPAFAGGVRVASGDVTGDFVDDLITGAGAGGGPHVRVFDGETGTVFSEFFAFDANFTLGLFVGVTDIDGDGVGDILVGTGPGAISPVRTFDADGTLLNAEVGVFNPHFRSGVHVAGSLMPPLRSEDFDDLDNSSAIDMTIWSPFNESMFDDLLNLDVESDEFVPNAS